MCRIAGQVSIHTNTDSQRSNVAAMTLAMQHGGPDGEGQFLDDKNSVCFGHRRLALIDLSADGAQPMTDGSGNYTITFNGEIYNYQTIKTELQGLGYLFKNQTDTEVILLAYAHWGTAAFDRFNGMFAFALHDQKLQKVYLVRDQSGMKPLYYRVKDKELLFASEIRAFRTIGINQENPDWKVLFLAFGFIPEPATILDEVLMLPKGSFLVWTIEAESAKVETYLQPEKQTYITDLEEAKRLIRQSFGKAVQQHLIADAPVGLFLSGGIDSGIIALEAAQSRGLGLHTLSLTFDDLNFDESRYQLIIASKIGSQHHSINLNQKAFNEQTESILQIMDQPSADGLNTWFVAQLAKKQGLKAALSGLGGDELFGGYPSFKRISFLKKLNKSLPGFALQLFQKFPKKAYQKLAYLSLQSPVGYYLSLRGYFIPNQIAAILNIPVKEVWQIIRGFNYPKIAASDPYLFTAQLEQDFYMKHQLLHDSDMMGMQHGIEIRMPFLDKEFVKTVNSIHPSIRFDKKLVKGLLVKSYEDLLPKEIWNRRKMGFSFPMQKWLKTNPVITNLEASKNPSIASFTKLFLKGKVHWSKMLILKFVNS